MHKGLAGLCGNNSFKFLNPFLPCDHVFEKFGIVRHLLLCGKGGGGLISSGVSVAGGGLAAIPSWLFFIIFPLLQFGQEYCRKNLAGQVLALYFPSWTWDADSHSGQVVQLLHLLGQAVPAHLLAADRCSY
ncbi:hypothetical protein GQ457_06G012190 [Hibiscus cannabinus]